MLNRYSAPLVPGQILNAPALSSDLLTRDPSHPACQAVFSSNLPGWQLQASADARDPQGQLRPDTLTAYLGGPVNWIAAEPGRPTWSGALDSGSTY